MGLKDNLFKKKQELSKKNNSFTKIDDSKEKARGLRYRMDSKQKV